MRTETRKNWLASARLAAVVAALCLAAQTASAGRDFDASLTLEALAAPAFLGGVSLRMEAAAATDFHAAPTAFDREAIGYSIVSSPEPQGTVGTDPIQTAAITKGVFGSVAIPMRNFPVARRWRPIYQAIEKCAADGRCGPADDALTDIVAAAGQKGFLEKLADINRGINRLVTYRRDKAVYGSLDHWARPAEILKRRAGDCEDFAILKMTALANAGIPFESMSLVVLQDRQKGVFHAVLSVSTGSGNFILDNVRNEVLLDTDLPSYLPLYSFSTDRAWIHGLRPGGPQLAGVGGSLASVMPGEGPGASVAERPSTAALDGPASWRLRTGG